MVLLNLRDYLIFTDRLEIDMRFFVFQKRLVIQVRSYPLSILT